MVASVLLYIYFTRQLGVIVFVYVIQTLIYSELVKLAIKASVEAQMPIFRFFYVYWFIVFSFFMYVSTLKGHITSALGLLLVQAAHEPAGPQLPQWAQHAAHAALFVVKNIVPISFVLYMVGFVAFVVSLRQRRNFRYQFTQFGYCHLALIIVVGQSTFFVSNVFQGLLWFVLPIGLVVLNDSFAYVTGFLCGRTPLTRLSPKKTVEGFVGGAVATFVGALVLTHLMQGITAFDVKYLMLCPASEDFGVTVNRCDLEQASGGIFRSAPLSQWWFQAWVPAALRTLPLSEMQLHALVLAAFASAVAPFGGFFASGFKRAFHIKDFGTAIPGHGGFTDRMDCQIVMGAFSAVYLTYVLQLGVGLRGGPADVLHVFGRVLARFRPQDVALLHELLACAMTSANVPALLGGGASGAGGGGGGGGWEIPRAVLAEAAASCRAQWPQLLRALHGDDPAL